MERGIEEGLRKDGMRKRSIEEGMGKRRIERIIKKYKNYSILI